MNAIFQRLARMPTTFRLGAIALAALLWVYWPTLVELAGRWGSDSQFSHGYLVPFFALFLLWNRRHLLPLWNDRWATVPPVPKMLAEQVAGKSPTDDLLRDRLKPAPALDTQRSDPHIKDPGGSRHAVRQDSSKTLEQGGKLADPAVRQALLKEGLRPSPWGFVVLVVGLAIRFAGTYTYFSWLSATSLLICLTGLVLLVGGAKALRWAWPAIAFLIFMIPMPFRVEVALAHPLQSVATVASTYTLQSLGFPAVAEGNVIRIGEVRLGIVEACSGLSMLQIFFALSTAVTLLMHGCFLEKMVIFLSAIPIALASNITRIVVTGIMHVYVGRELADLVFHDLAGWLMMPLALGMLWGLVKVLSWVLEKPRESERVALEDLGIGTKRRARATPVADSKADVALSIRSSITAHAKPLRGKDAS
jgi:exosortase